MEKIEKLVEEIEKLSVIELSDLVKAIEEKFGVSAAAAVVAAGAGAGAAAGPGRHRRAAGQPDGVLLRAQRHGQLRLDRPRLRHGPEAPV